MNRTESKGPLCPTPPFSIQQPKQSSKTEIRFYHLPACKLSKGFFPSQSKIPTPSYDLQGLSTSCPRLLSRLPLPLPPPNHADFISQTLSSSFPPQLHLPFPVPEHFSLQPYSHTAFGTLLKGHLLRETSRIFLFKRAPLFPPHCTPLADFIFIALIKNSICFIFTPMEHKLSLE